MLALLLVAGAGAGEFTARQLIRSRIARLAPALGDSLTARTAGGPALWALAHRRIPRLDLSTEDARLGPLPQVTVRARLDDVRLGAATSVAGTHAEVTVPVRSLGAAVRAAAGSVPVGQVRSDPVAGTVEVTLGQGGLGRLTLRPVIADGRVSLTVSSLTVLGRAVPPSSLGSAGGLGGAGGLGAADGRPYPLGLRAGSVQVLPEGLRVVLDGGPGTLSGRDGGWTAAPGPAAAP
ncbi:LmeA family phospholipid-binding protein [Kitasatospora indigofera]|uniref:LmeA family phospholipid-binding protein n=1 Tax=Kitasatospora indigofera TaxID=67307 RepID=UPI0036BB19C0